MSCEMIRSNIDFHNLFFEVRSNTCHTPFLTDLDENMVGFHQRHCALHCLISFLASTYMDRLPVLPDVRNV